MSKKPLFFIYQNGFRQISLPPKQEGYRNFETINITSCTDGCLVTVDGDMEEAADKLNEFINHPVVNIYCDTNSISEGDVFLGAKVQKSNYNGELIYLNY
ncbi:hypothetical protein ACTFR8_22955 [Bacillus cereus group sp. MYBK15-3]|uniref:hypothetical protein n=1 Tax=Bacillus cereus group TaxID=86661 RepID=UPI001C8CD562|nr:hypothetical protein [Bacillus cereus]MBX9158458.1 hypothetical protein [Bacillus cereus]